MIKLKELYVEKHDRTATIIMNRPNKKNALNLAMFKQLSVLLDEIAADQDVKVLILRGADDKAFSSGADISEFLENRTSAVKAKQYNDTALAAVEKLYHFPKPTIAVIQGLAIGGGMELALACDFRFASKESLLGITAAKLGIIYNLSSTKRLMNAVGPAVAKEMLYTGKIIKGSEGKENGLIDFLCDQNEINDEAFQFAAQLAEKSLVALNGTKEVIHAVLNGAVEENDHIAQLVLSSFESDDYKEGIDAFLEKRKPNFK